jgi:eukaryotic-like serine/threonine-protein kinase
MEDKPLASRLIGKTIGKWTVIEKRVKDEADNSGYFSTCYYVKDKSDNKAFLKAYNYQYAFNNKSGSADVLRFMTENFTYERDLLLFCNDMKMRRVVTAIDSGEYQEPDEALPVPYLIFEIAQGSLKTINFLQNPDLVWKLKAFHGALVGLSQLHSAHIVHQDIKPSNILIFGEDYSKISDLGSATKMEKCSNWDKPNHVGDLRYAPIELLYGYCSNDWRTRRFGADLFMMGGILSYMISGLNMLSQIVSKLNTIYKPMNYQGTYGEITPILLNAFYQSIEELKKDLPLEIRNEMIEILSELLNPIPEERGNPANIRERIGQYSLIRYISKIDRLSKTVMWMNK